MPTSLTAEEAAAEIHVATPAERATRENEQFAAGAGTDEQPSAAVPEANSPRGSENAFAITSFVLGIASIVSGWTLIAPIIGLVFGVLALRRRSGERTLALWGVWLNAAMLALTVLAIIGVLIFVGFALIAGLPILADATIVAG